MYNNSINIIGYGYVGSAVGYVCEQNDVVYNVCDLTKKDGTYDYFTSDIRELIAYSESNNVVNYYFIAVPTPSKDDGSCDTSIINNVLKTLNEHTTKETKVIIKSTLVPGSCSRFSDMYKNIDIILSPEFLRESTYKVDMYDTDFILVGVSKNRLNYDNIIQLFKRLHNHKQIDVYLRSYEECEMFKYTLNVHLAVKVWYFNEIYEIAEKLGVNYNHLKELFKLDKRIGHYGTQVPGHDGKFGYGLSCLPKETRGMMKLQEDLKIDNQVLKEIIKRNDYFRKK